MGYDIKNNSQNFKVIHMIGSSSHMNIEHKSYVSV
jgi:hypothetical protein